MAVNLPRIHTHTHKKLKFLIVKLIKYALQSKSNTKQKKTN